MLFKQAALRDYHTLFCWRYLLYAQWSNILLS